MRKKLGYGFLIFLLCIGAIIALQFLFYNVPSVAISCNDGEFKGFSTNQMPPACIACIPYCYGEIEILNSSGQLVCKNSYKEFRDVVLVPCKELKDFKKQNLTIKYKTEGLNKSFENEVNTTYNG